MLKLWFSKKHGLNKKDYKYNLSSLNYLYNINTNRMINLYFFYKYMECIYKLIFIVEL